MDDQHFLERAVALARRGADSREGGPFGAVVVHSGRIIAEGWNRVIASCDPTAHAEVVALRDAALRLGRYHLDDCVLYASSEPCPMCLSAAYWARVQRIVFANTRAAAAAIGFCDDDLYGELSRPHDARLVPITHLPLANADEPMRRWLMNPQHTLY